ncbi:MAG: hypothetical protein K2K30_00465, partial [Alistipes sp.]|nr:hypothetical protein [Alistipes sp.]
MIKFADRNTVQFDILVQRPGEQDQKFRDLGCEIHVIPYTNKCEYRLAVRTFLSKMQYVAVHAHMHEHMHVVLQAAREAGVKHCVAHSHNARIDIPRVLWPLRLIKHRRYEKYATDLFGCSQLALKWLFPLRWRTGRVIYNDVSYTH